MAVAMAMPAFAAGGTPGQGIPGGGYAQNNVNGSGHASSPINDTGGDDKNVSVNGKAKGDINN